MKLYLNIIVFGLFLASFGWIPQSGASTVKPAELSAQERADILRMENYLTQLNNIRADFMQVNDAGHMRFGSFALKRPGKMRIDYADPDKDFIVADGIMIHMWDSELEQQSSVTVGDGIASYILRDPISLTTDEITITRFARYPAKIEVSFVMTKAPEEGELTLVFEDKPLKLRQWKVLDPQGRLTGVTLQNVRENVEFKSSEFVFVSPNLGKQHTTGG